MKQQTFRHVCIDFADGHTISIQTTDSVENVLSDVKSPKSWKNGIVPEIIRVWVERW